MSKRLTFREVAEAAAMFGGILRFDDNMTRAKLQEVIKAQAGGRLDAATIPAFSQDLEDTIAVLYEAVHPELVAANGEVVPIISTIHEGAETYSWRAVDVTGFAAAIDSYSTADIPVVNIFGEKNVRKVRSVATSFVRTVQDLRAEGLRNRNVNGPPLRLEDLGRKGITRAIDQSRQDILLWGNPGTDHEGLLNNPEVPLVVLPDGVGGSSLWETKTPDEIVADCAAVIDGPEEITNMVETVGVCWLPVAKFNYVRRTRMGNNADRTILTYLKENFPEVTFKKMNELATAKSGGQLNANMMYALKVDAEACAGVVPMGMLFYAPELDGLRWRVFAEERQGGIACQRPLSQSYGVGL